MEFLGLFLPLTSRKALPVGLSFEMEGKYQTVLLRLWKGMEQTSETDISDHIVLLLFMSPELLVGFRVKERPLLMKWELPRPPGSYLARPSQGLISKDKVEFALFPLLQNMRILSNLFISHRSKIPADFIFFWDRVFRLSLNSWSSCLSFPSPGCTDTHHSAHLRADFYYFFNLYNFLPSWGEKGYLKLGSANKIWHFPRLCSKSNPSSCSSWSALFCWHHFVIHWPVLRSRAHE